MTRITLQPIDDGQKTVEIPVGKTTIGRGPFLGCGDKKVSRNHAILEVTEQGEVFLTPTHVNPCFYQPTIENPGTILKKDKPHKLENGDLFSLLPRAFRYKLVIDSDSGGEASTDKGVENSDEKVNGVVEDGNSANAGVNGECSSNRQGECSEDKNESKKSVAVSADIETSNNLVHQPYIETPPPELEDGNGDENIMPLADDVRLEAEQEREPKQEQLQAQPEEKEDEETEKKERKEPEKIPDSIEGDDDDSRNSRTLPEWINDTSNTPTTSKEEKKRPKTTKQHHREKASAKRKTADAGSPEKKKKKKRETNKFDDEEHPQRPSSGRSSRTNRQTRHTISLDDFVASDDDEWQSDKSEPRMKKRRRSKRRDDDSGSDWEIEHKKSRKVSHKYESGSESGSDWGSSSQKKKKTTKVRRRRSKRVFENETISEEEDDDEEEEEKSSAGKPEKRLPCQYGKKCYRKNASHLDQFSHPGDSDYESEAEGKEDEQESGSDDASDLPECPYGTTCFRKNPQHKKEYKHTKKVRPQREAAKQAVKKTPVSKDSEEPESYDLEDSLVNDDSDEYKPNESGSEVDDSQENSSPAKGAKQPNAKNKKVKRV